MIALNRIYSGLEGRCMEVRRNLSDRGYACDWGWFNGHYRKDASGEYIREAFPIPVISIRGLCDIEINLDCITVSTKLTRQDALAFNAGVLAEIPFEAYGVEDYRKDFYTYGMTLARMRQGIAASTEREIGFSFAFSRDALAEAVGDFIDILPGNRFYY